MTGEYRLVQVKQGPPPPEPTTRRKPPREGVCPECWGWSFHRDECSRDDGKPRPEARA